MVKTCSKCGEEKDLRLFCKDSKSSDDKQSQCKKCKSNWISNYYINNPYKRFKRTKEQSLKRYYKDKLRYNISRNIRKSLSSGKNNMGWEKLVGYTLKDLKKHLEKKFRDNMSWDNYGKVWHIDHKKPISLFKIIDYNCKEFKDCWSLKNLQPLLVEENLKKSNKYGAIV